MPDLQKIAKMRGAGTLSLKKGTSMRPGVTVRKKVVTVQGKDALPKQKAKPKAPGGDKPSGSAKTPPKGEKAPTKPLVSPTARELAKRAGDKATTAKEWLNQLWPNKRKPFAIGLIEALVDILPEHIPKEDLAAEVDRITSSDAYLEGCATTDWRFDLDGNKSPLTAYQKGFARGRLYERERLTKD